VAITRICCNHSAAATPAAVAAAALLPERNSLGEARVLLQPLISRLHISAFAPAAL